MPRPLLGDNDVDLWLADCPPDEGLERAAWAMLSAEEQECASRLRRHEDRALRIRTRALVRQVLGSYLRTRPGDVALGSGAEGKPEVVTAERPGWPRFNVSHSGSMALIAVSGNREVGVDIERVRSDLDWQEVARTYFASAEVTTIEHAPPIRQRDLFFECWVRKEAYLKGLGTGLGRETRDFDVSLAAPGGRVQDPARAGVPHPVWFVHGVAVGRGYAAAVAVDGGPEVTIRGPWSPGSA